MKVTVIQLYQDKYTQEIHKPGEEIEVTSSRRVQELMDAGVIEEVTIPEPTKDDLPFPEAVKAEESEPAKPVKKATGTKKTTKRVKKND